MINYSKWPRKRVLVTTLKLDDYNPRLPGVSKSSTPTQPQIIQYLIDHERVIDLAKSILTTSFLPNEEPIVTKEGNRYIVLEGNRRVAACKIIVNPDLIKSPGKKKSITKLLADFDLDIISKLSVLIAPDRESADVIIVNRHTEGSAIEKWDKTKQDRFFFNRHNDGESIEELALKFNLPKPSIKEALVRHNVYEELRELQLDEKERKLIEDETSFNMTTIERVYKSKQGKDFLGLDYDKDGNLIHSLPKEEYSKRLKKITQEVLSSRLNSRTYGDEQLQEKYLKELRKDDSLNFTIQPNKAFQSEYIGVKELSPSESEDNSEEEKAKIIVPRGTPANKLIPSDLKWRSGITRIDKILKELKAANLDSQFNGTAVLFRSYLDMIVYQYLLKTKGIEEIIRNEQQKLDTDNKRRYDKVSTYIKSLVVPEVNIIESELNKALNHKTGVSRDWVPSLKQMLAHLASSSTLLEDLKLRQALASYVKGNDSFLDHNDFNLLVHNEYFVKDGKDLKKAWEQLFPILEYIYGKLST